MARRCEHQGRRRRGRGSPSWIHGHGRPGAIVPSRSCCCTPDSDTLNSRYLTSINFSRPNQHSSVPPAEPGSSVLGTREENRTVFLSVDARRALAGLLRKGATVRRYKRVHCFVVVRSLHQEPPPRRPALRAQYQHHPRAHRPTPRRGTHRTRTTHQPPTTPRPPSHVCVPTGRSNQRRPPTNSNSGSAIVHNGT